MLKRLAVPLRISIVLAALSAAGLRAQIDFFPRGSDERDYYYSAVQVASSRTAEQQIERARLDVAAGEWERAARLLQAALTDGAQAAIRLEDGSFRSLRDVALELLMGMPPVGFETYRRIFDPYAREAFQLALEKRDAAELKAVYARYTVTTHGPEALSAALSLHMERGEVSDATSLGLFALESRFTDLATRRFAAAGVLLSLEALGRRDEIERLNWPDELLNTTVKVGGADVRIGDLKTRILAALPPSPPAQHAPHSTAMFDQPAWRTSFDLHDRRDPSTVMYFDFGSQSSAVESNYAYNPVVPAMDDSTVYWSNGLAVYAASLFSGEDKWRRPVFGPVAQSQARRNFSITHPVTVSQGLVFAALETPVREGRRIMHFMPTISVPHRQLHAIDAATGNVVWRHTGIRSGNNADDALIEGLNVNSSPLIIGDNLYVAASRFHTAFHQYLCCFDTFTGRLKWATFVCTGQMEQNMFGNRVRESITGDVALKDGLLWFSTNVGIVAAVDARIGTLRFALPYQQIPVPRQRHIDTSIYERAPGWANGRPVIWDDYVFIAPMDSQDLMKIHRGTGRMSVVMSRDPRKPARWLIGEYGDRLIVGGAALTFYDCANGQKLSELVLASGRDARRGGIQGRPAIIGNALYAVIRFEGREALNVCNLDTLDLQEPIRFKSERAATLGMNLAVSETAVVVSATDVDRDRGSIRCYLDLPMVKARLLELLKTSPDDPAIHLKLGELALQEADPKTAVAAFEHAYDLAAMRRDVGSRTATAARDALLRFYLALATQPAGARLALGTDVFGCYEKAIEYAGTDARRIEILFLLLKDATQPPRPDRFEKYVSLLLGRYRDATYDYTGEFAAVLPELPERMSFRRAGVLAAALFGATLEAAGEPERAIEQWQEVIRSYAQESMGARSAWHVAWSRIDALMGRFGRGLYARHESQAEALFEEARATRELGPLDRLLSHYPNSALVVKAYVEIARRHLKAGDHAAAARAVHDFLMKMGQPSGDELFILASALDAAGCMDSARQVFAYGREVVPLGIVGDGDEIKTFAEIADRRIGERKPTDRRGAYRLPTLTAPLHEAWRRTDHLDVKWTLYTPPGPAAGLDSVLAHAGEKLMAIARDDGRTLFEMACATAPEPEHFAWHDGRVIVFVDGDIVALDAARGRELWRADLKSDSVDAIVAGHGKVWLLIRNVIAGDFRVQARSILDGRVISESLYSGSPGRALSIAGRWILATIDDERRAIVLDAVTGRAAPAFTDGVAYSDVIRPLLNADGMLVSVTPTPMENERQIQAVDPASGRVVWSRLVGEGVIRDDESDPYTIAYDRATTKAERTQVPSTSSIHVIDVLLGTSLVTWLLDEDTTLRPSTLRATSEDIFMTPRRATRGRNTFAYDLFIENVAFSTRDLRWRSVPMAGVLDFRPIPFDGGVIAVAIERKVKGNRRSVQRTTLFLIHPETGSIVQDIVLDTEEVISKEQPIVLNGMLIVADGSILKGFKP